MNPPRAAQGEKILVVEDDASLRDLIQVILSEQGFVVDAAGTSQAALELARAGHHKLLVLDLILPDADGVILHGKLKKLLPGIEDRTIFMTGLTAEGPVIEYLRSLGAAFLQKPFKPVELIGAVAKVSHRHRAH